LYLFDLRVFEAISRTPRTAMRDEYELTDSIQILIDYEYPVRVAPVVQWDMNLTYIGDLIACCVHQLSALGQRFLVGHGCSIADGVELIDTVVGDNVTITRPTAFERCVVLSDVVLREGGRHRDAVFTKDAKLDALSPAGEKPE
jgi:dTDP-glucose pyrophosphorylase